MWETGRHVHILAMPFNFNLTSYPLHLQNSQYLNVLYLKGHAQVYNHQKNGDFILAYYYDHMM